MVTGVVLHGGSRGHQVVLGHPTESGASGSRGQEGRSGGRDLVDLVVTTEVGAEHPRVD